MKKENALVSIPSAQTSRWTFVISITTLNLRYACHLLILLMIVGPWTLNSFAQNMAAGGFHSLAVCGDGTVMDWGFNNDGELGNGTTSGLGSNPTPVQVIGLTNISAITGGLYHSFALKNNGTVWSWGANWSGQLGDGTIIQRTTPVQVSGLTGTTAIAGREVHSLALKNNGTVWAWGSNWAGGLGDGTTTDRWTPVQVIGLTGITAIGGRGRGDHSLALKNDGTVWAWGYNSSGQLGDGTTANRLAPVQVIGLTGIIAIGAGWAHSLAMRNDGTVWAWGKNNSGQLGDNTTIDRWTPVQVSGITGSTAMAGGIEHSLALKNDGTVWAWGYNASGALGDGTTTDRWTPVQVSGLTGIKTIAAGDQHSLALKNDGTLWACGWNYYGQLGDGTTSLRTTPVQVTSLCPIFSLFSTAVTTTSPLCNAQCTGTGTVTPSGGSSPYTYLWSSMGQTTQTATGFCAGTYTVTVTDAAGSTATATVTITQPTLLTASVTATNSVCGSNNGNAAVTANGGTPGYTYSWNPAVAGQTTATATGLGAGTYTVTVTDANGCDTTQIVTVVASGSVTAAATNSTICAGQVATLTASGGTNYSWNTGATTSSLTLTLTSASTFTVIVSSGLCSDTANATVTVTSGISTNQSASICTGYTYTLPGGTVVSAGGIYIDTLISGGGCDSIITTILTVDSVLTTNQSASVCSGSTYTLPGGTVVSTGGTYIDTLVSIAGCDSIITTTILTVNSSPTATVFSSPTMSGQVVTITQGQSVTLMASGGGTYSWSNGSNGSSITVIPSITTLYCVTVIDSNNCTDTACLTVTIEPIDCSSAGEIYLPNAFSPNGDGENDKLQIYYGNIKCIKTFQLVIYNRWGGKVFETSNSAAEWDGTFKGRSEGTAVFVYYLEATLHIGEQITRKGNVSLIR